MKWFLVIMTATLMHQHASQITTITIPVESKEKCLELANSAKEKTPEKHYFVSVTCNDENNLNDPELK